MRPGDSLLQHFRLAPPQQKALKKLGIATVLDLLYHFPTRYDQAGGEASIAGLTIGQEATIYGTIKQLKTRRSWKRKIPIGEGVIEDSSGKVKVMWFHQPYLAKKFSEGAFVKAVGEVGGTSGSLYLANPHVELADPTDAGLFSRETKPASERQFFAVYPESRGVTSLWFRHAIDRALKSDILEHIKDSLPEESLSRFHLPGIADALRFVHAPQDVRHAEAARKRFAFEEIFALQIARARDRAENDVQRSFPVDNAASTADIFMGSIPFPPTAAQIRAIKEICVDLGKAHPMARLLEGDVGAGKTLVAAASAYAVVTSRPPQRKSGTLQVAYMAPTEILARQHFESFIAYFRDLPIQIGLITGSGCRKFPSKSSPGSSTEISRTQLLKWVENGEIAMFIGTHALIQKSVKFQHLAYAIVDEQHRFGTRQRRELAQKSGAAGTLPHFLSMTATPIPRTLALTMYGDLDISVLDELPPGRVKITTKIVTPKTRAAAYEALREELQRGRQAFVICPRIEEPDPEKVGALMAVSAKAEAKRLQKDIFPEFKIGLLHGAMKPAEKDEAMAAFAAGLIDILVATSVVEVGVNVPNATVIMIEGAERFGLSQLHQLRGRVQRSTYPPTCFLLPATKSELSLKRLRALEKSSDGFALAESDLENRGAGDLYGREQWGVSDIGMEALKNPKLIEAARDEARKIVAQDPSLARHTALAERVKTITTEFHAE